MKLVYNITICMTCALLVSCASTGKVTTDYTRNASRSRTERFEPRARSNGSGAHSTSTSAARTVNIIRSESHKLVGVPYRYGGDSPQRGFDCSGLTCYLYKKANISLPRTSSAQVRMGPLLKYTEARAGDLIFFGTGNRVNHVGIVLRSSPGTIEVIHSTSSAGVISQNVLASRYWSSRLIGVVRLSDLTRSPGVADH